MDKNVKKLPVSRLTVLYPFLFALYPVFFLFAINVDEVPIFDVATAATVVIILAGVVFFLCFAFLRSLEKSAIITSLFFTLLFSYSYVYELGDHWIRNIYLLPLWGLIFLVGFWFIGRTRRDLSKLTIILSFIISVLISFSVIQVSLFKIRESLTANKDNLELSEFSTDISELPDIYYILLDAYESSWGLAKFYAFDNSDFTDTLRDKGFLTIEKSRSNYNSTFFTITALLNMNYLQNLSSTAEFSEDTVNPAALIQNDLVSKLFKSIGYTNIHFGSRWAITKNKRFADINVNIGVISEFMYVLYGLTPLHAFNFDARFITKRFDQWTRINYQFDQLEKIPEMEEATFTFVHFGVPHQPFVFNRDGSFLSRESAWEEDAYKYNTDDYVNQLVFVNNRLIKAVDSILSKSSMPPIIIIQSDHGSRLYKPVGRRGFDADDERSKIYYREYLRNFSAYYLPDIGDDKPYEEMTQVNVFRLILKHYFHAKIELLEDRSYYVPAWDYYRLRDVTELVAY